MYAENFNARGICGGGKKGFGKAGTSHLQSVTPHFRELGSYLYHSQKNLSQKVSQLVHFAVKPPS